MKEKDLWEKYCSFYEKDFHWQVEHNEKRMEQHFKIWKETDSAKIFGKRSNLDRYQDVPITRYSDYAMLDEFGRKLAIAVERDPKKPGELFKTYYDRISREIGSSMDRYMVEPFYLCTKTTGTTGESKWIVHGKTFWQNFAQSSIATAVISCSEGWGTTELKNGDKCLNMNAPIPYVSGWAALASETELRLVPSIEVSDSLSDMREKFTLVLKAISKGERIVAAGGIGSLFYMICKYFVEPEEFYREYYRQASFGLKKMLLYLKILESKLGKKEKKSIVDFLPLKGVLVAGMEARLYIDFFKKEFDFEPLNIYGSTEAGPLMRGDPDRKTDLVPDLRTSYLEFQTETGETKNLDELKKGEIYNLVVTPFGSILFRYDMEDFLRVIDFRDDGMPIFEFETRKTTIIRLYSWYRVTPNVVVQALCRAGLRSSENWAVVKLLKPREHLHFIMEKEWPYTESEAEKIIFNSLIETESEIPHRGRTLKDYIVDFKMDDPSEICRVEYLKPGAFLRYSMMKARTGSPIGQYKPPKIIPSEKMEIYEALRSA